MTQQVLMILPSTEDEKPRMVGPFLTEATANAWADSKEIEPYRRVIRPLESPTSIYGYGRHALIPSPTPRRMVDMVPGEGALRGRDAAKINPTGVAGALAAWEAKKEAARQAPRNRTWIEGEPVTVPPGVPVVASGTGGVQHWITGEALELAPWNVLANAEATADWHGPIARFNHPTTDGRTLELNGLGSGDWLSHFTRVPVGVWVRVPQEMGVGGALPIGLCERVRVEDGWLLAEGRISLAHFQKAAPELYASITSGAFDAREYIPAAIDVTNGVHGGTPGASTISGPWELERVVFGSDPAWPGCRVFLGDYHLELKHG